MTQADKLAEALNNIERYIDYIYEDSPYAGSTVVGQRFKEVYDEIGIAKRELAEYEAEKTAIHTADIAEDGQRAIRSFERLFNNNYYWGIGDHPKMKKKDTELVLQALSQPAPEVVHMRDAMDELSGAMKHEDASEAISFILKHPNGVTIRGKL